MCGFAGLIDPTGASDAAALEATAQRMASTLVHRGPDSQGLWSDRDAGVALGHRRLAVIDLSPEGHQPMVSRSGRYVIAYNGEVYNFGGLRRELEANGCGFHGNSDTEVVVEAIGHWGVEKALGRFVGMFAFALWDRRDRRLTLARDRLGIKPLYWGQTGRTFLFGSELRALAAHPEFRRELDREAIALFALKSCVPAPHTIYRDARKLEPGTLLTYAPETGDHKITRYWSLQTTAENGVENPFRGSREDAVSELDHLLHEVIGCRRAADVPLGVFLSGGIDSATVAAFTQEQSAQPVKTFSVGFPDAAFDEAKAAAAIAGHLGTDHHALHVSDSDAQAVVPRLGSLYDEPFADSSQIPTTLISEMTRRHVTVALSGDGGDEVFGGYNRYLWCDALDRTRRVVPSVLRRAAGRGMLALSPHAWDRVFAALRPALPAAFLQRNSGDKMHKLATILSAQTTDEMYRGLTTVWPSADAIIVGGTGPGRPPKDLCASVALPDGVARMMYLDTLGYLPDDILTKVDRASMSVGLEARVPLLDHRLVSFAWSLPAAWKMTDGVGKQILRDVLAKRVPPALTSGPKSGFATPLGDWLRGPLRDWAESLLDETRLRNGGVFQAGPVRQAWRQHLSGRRNQAHKLWPVLMFGQWLDQQGSGQAGPDAP